MISPQSQSLGTRFTCFIYYWYTCFIYYWYKCTHADAEDCGRKDRDPVTSRVAGAHLVLAFLESVKL